MVSAHVSLALITIGHGFAHSLLYHPSGIMSQHLRGEDDALVLAIPT